MSTTAAGLAERYGLRTASDSLAPTLPVHTALAPLFKGGALRCGTVVSVQGAAQLSLAYALAAGPSQRKLWCAAVGIGELGLSAAADLGLDPDRLIVLPDPGQQWQRAVSILIETVDVLLLAAPTSLPPSSTSRLHAKLRERQSVLIDVSGSSGAVSGSSVAEPSGTGPSRAGRSGAGISGASAVLTARATWHGLHTGYGRLRSRTVRISAAGKLAGPHTVSVSLPGEHGALAETLAAVS